VASKLELYSTTSLPSKVEMAEVANYLAQRRHPLERIRHSDSKGEPEEGQAVALQAMKHHTHTHTRRVRVRVRRQHNYNYHNHDPKEQEEI
jgi:hypothetical protein